MNKKRNLIMYIVLLYLLLAVAMFPNTSADPIESKGTFTVPLTICCPPTTYILCAFFPCLECIAVENNTMCLNKCIFRVIPCSGTATVSINSYSPPTMVFEVTATDEATMTFGGFTSGAQYKVSVDGVYWKTVTANILGLIAFTYPSFSTHTFSIVYSAPPEAAGVPGGGLPRPRYEEDAPEPPEPLKEDYTLPWIALSAAIGILIVMLAVVVLKKDKTDLKKKGMA